MGHLGVFFYICINYLCDKDINLQSVISISKIFFNVLAYLSCVRKHFKHKRNLIVETLPYSVFGLINIREFQAHQGCPVETSKKEKEVG